MSTQDVINVIRLEGFWTPQDLKGFDGDLKDALRQLQSEFAFDGFLINGGAVESVDFYEIDVKRFTPEKVIGVIHVAFIERTHPENSRVAVEKHHHLRYGFEVERKTGRLRLGKGVRKGSEATF